MTHLRPLLVLAALTACDAAIVANVQESAKAESAAEAQAQPQPAQAAAVADPPAAVKATVEAEALDLESINFLVKKGKVKDAAELEKLINDPKEQLSNVDIDGDGKIDKIQVVEVKGEGGGSTFELKVIPSKTKDKADAVVVAVITLSPDKVSKTLIVTAKYTPVVIGHETHVYTYDVPIELQGDTVVVVDKNPFFGWYFVATRPVYVGVFVYDIPPPPVIRWKGKGKGKHWHKKHHHKKGWH
jgi:hypothetical protein